MDFPTPHIEHPQTAHAHAHTIILLHGRGSTGPELASELFSSTASNSLSLPASLPSWRWVFPSSRRLWSTTFQEDIPAWFDVFSLDDIQERKELQTAELRESISHILDVLEYEIGLLNGEWGNVYLGGISQGMATALWAFLGGAAMGRIGGKIGGVLGFCGWLPFASDLEALLEASIERETPISGQQMLGLVSGFFVDTIAQQPHAADTKDMNESILSTPLFLGHGADDEWVTPDLGRQASGIMQKFMARVEWNEYTGAEGDGHWIKAPEGFDQMLRFLAGEKGS